MFSIRYLLSKKARLVFLLSTVSIVIALIVTLNSVLDSFKETLMSHRKNTPFDLMLVPSLSSGESGLFLKTELVEKKLAGVDGIAQMEPVLEFSQLVEFSQRTQRIQAISFSKGLSHLKLISGHMPEKDNQIVIDSSLSRTLGASIGSTFKIKGEQLKIVGLTENHRVYSSPVVYFKPSKLRKIHGIGNRAHYYFITVDEGVKTDDVSKELASRFRNVQILSWSQYMATLEEYFSFMDAIFYLLQGFILAIGILVIGVTVFASVAERTRELGTIRAIGASGYYLSFMILKEVLLTSAVSLVIGFGLGNLLLLIFPKIMPIDIYLDPGVYFLTVFYVLLMSIIGSLLGIRKAIKTDPLVAMKAI